MIVQEKFWIMMALMMVSPFIFMWILPDPFASVAIIGSNLFMLLYIRRFWKGMAGNMFGRKAGFICTTCQGSKFDSKGTCRRCGSRSKRLA